MLMSFERADDETSLSYEIYEYMRIYFTHTCTHHPAKLSEQPFLRVNFVRRVTVVRGNLVEIKPWQAVGELSEYVFQEHSEVGVSYDKAKGRI